jgi:uncharacterized protein YggE
MLPGVSRDALAQNPDTARVRVAGGAQVSVRLVPTRAVVHLLIEATAATAHEAVSQAAEGSGAVLDTLRRAGGAADLTLVQYGVAPTPVNHPTPANGPRNSYTSRAAVRFTTPLSNVQVLTAAAYARGASASAPLQFLHEGLDSAIARAVEEASSLARLRAEAIARGLGGSLGPLIGIETHPVYNGAEYQPSPGFPAPMGYDHTPRPIPEIKYTVQVTGSWRFVPR